MKTVNSQLLREARADKERFISWGGQELFDRFTKFKTRLEQPQNDMTYWTSTREPHQPDELNQVLRSLEAEAEEKENKKKLAKEGAEILFEDESWLVYKIKTFEACKKYGAGSRWCITGKNMQGQEAYGNRYWDSYTRDGTQFYFFLKKGTDEKFALALKEDDDEYSIFNAADQSISHIEGAPQVEGLPDVSQPRGGEDEEYEEGDDNPGNIGQEAVPQPFTLEDVENPLEMQFLANSLQSALTQFNNAEFIESLNDMLNIIKMGENRYTVFVFNGQAAGPLMTQSGQNSYSLLVFNDVNTLRDWAQHNLPNIQIQDNADLGQPEQENESFTTETKDFDMNNEIKEGLMLLYIPEEEFPVDDEPEPIVMESVSGFSHLQFFR